MADLSSNFLGIKSPNPFWLASGPPADKSYNVNRAFDAGWLRGLGQHGEGRRRRRRGRSGFRI